MTAHGLLKEIVSKSGVQVGVGVVILRKAKDDDAAEVLLVRRAKPPEVGKWTFPGGSLELGGYARMKLFILVSPEGFLHRKTVSSLLELTMQSFS
jgi:hypothetical protein